MIAADDVALPWWVLGPWTQDSDPPVELLDRPCDVCKGQKPPYVSFGPGMMQMECSDRCIDGRHTFEIEVEIGRGLFSDPSLPSSRPLRVSVVEGMVLPVYGEDPGDWPEMLTAGEMCVVLQRHGAAVLWDGAGGFSSVVMPPAVEPGMFAVKLRVAP